MRAALGVMKPKGGGIIVNIMSTTAFDGMNGSSGSLYVASKYALRGLTNVVREELKGTGVSVVGAYPGGFKSDIFREAVPKNFDTFMDTDEVASKIIANIVSEEPQLEQIIPRLGQTLPDYLK
jgi:NAD(P)-dependent dehydrogenase (short-subunit alcohol dehydrogenase family)